jgi:hypothetical protein
MSCEGTALDEAQLARIYRENSALFVPEAQVWAECDSLIELHAWDPSRIKPRDWIENFTDAERPFALQMLHRFVFFPDHLTDELLAAAFHQISGLIAQGKEFPQANNDWEKFRAEAILTYVTGEKPNPADSGLLFARKARQTLGFAENEIVSPDDAVSRTADQPGQIVVFVDDFVGSGNQFCATWMRPVQCSDGSHKSFADLSATGALTAAYYCNAASTVRGLQKIASICGAVHVFSGNVIGPDSSFVDPASTRWPTALRDVGRAFVEGIKPRYDFLAENGGQSDWRGFHRLGLGLAFAHSTPDATLPIFHSERSGWQPLVKRS